MWLEFLEGQLKRINTLGYSVDILKNKEISYKAKSKHFELIIKTDLLGKTIVSLNFHISLLDTYIFLDSKRNISIDFNYFGLDINTIVNYSEESKADINNFLNAFIYSPFYFTLTTYKDTKIDYKIDYQDKFGSKSKRMIFSSIFELNNFFEGDLWINRFLRWLVFRFKTKEIKRVRFECKNGQIFESHAISEK